MKRGRVRALVVCAFALASFVPLLVHTTQAAAGPLGSIAGQITNSARSPVPGVTVEIFVPTGCGGSTSDSATTDASGNYVINNVPAGTYTVELFTPEPFPDPQFISNTTQSSSAAPVTVAAGQNVTGENDVLVDGGSITGTVTDAATRTGQGNIAVSAFDSASGGSGFATTASAGSGSPAGTYTISRLPAGSNYQVSFRDFNSPKVFVDQTVTGVAVNAPGSKTVDATLVTGGTISGTVKDSNNTRLGGIDVSVFDSASGGSGFATTQNSSGSAPGSYSISGLPAGSNYQVTFSDGNFPKVFLDQTQGGISPGPTPVDAVLAKGGAITGTVKDPNKALLDGIDVSVFDSTSGGSGSATTGTSGPGTYTIGGLPSGTNYQVSFRDFNSPKVFIDQTTSGVSVTAPNSKTVSASMVVGGTITGRVFDASNKGVGGVDAEALSTGSGVNQSTFTLADGTYTIGGLPTDTYAVEYFGAAISGSLFFHDKTTFATADPVSVTQGATHPGVDQQVPTLVACTTTALASAPNPSNSGQTVTFTATVTPFGGSTPSGQVTFLDGSTTLGTGTLDTSGVATLATNTLSVGTHQISAAYAGTASDNASSSSSLSQVVNAVSLSPTTTTVSSAPNPSAPGQGVAFTVHVTPSSGSPPPTGQVTLSDGASSLGTGTLDSTGTATFSISGLTTGSHPITASYPGDSASAASTSSVLTQIVSGTTLTSSPNPSAPNQPVTFTATVFPATSATPTGTVTFNDGTTPLGTGTLDSAGNATLTTSALSNGSHQITAAYGGDANNPASTSSPLTQTVGNAFPPTKPTTTTTSTTAGPTTTLAPTSTTQPGTTLLPTTSILPATTTSVLPTTTLPATTLPSIPIVVPHFIPGPPVTPSPTTAPTSTTTPETTTTTTAPVPPPAPGGQVVALASPSGVPGGDEVVNGKGCPPGSTVELTLEGQHVGSALAAPDGTFKSHIEVPLLAVGLHDVVAQCAAVTLRTPITIVLSTAAPAAAATVLVAVLGFFLLLGLALIFLRPQEGVTLGAIYRRPESAEGPDW